LIIFKFNSFQQKKSRQLKIVEDNHQSPSMKPYGKKTSSKLDAIKQQLLTSKLDNNNHSSKHNSLQPHAKLSPSKSMTNYYKLLSILLSKHHWPLCQPLHLRRLLCHVVLAMIYSRQQLIYNKIMKAVQCLKI